MVGFSHQPEKINLEGMIAQSKTPGTASEFFWVWCGESMGGLFTYWDQFSAMWRFSEKGLPHFIIHGFMAFSMK